MRSIGTDIEEKGELGVLIQESQRLPLLKLGEVLCYRVYVHSWLGASSLLPTTTEKRNQSG